MVTVRDSTPDDLAACLDIIRMLPDFFTPDVHDAVRQAFDEHACWVTTKAGEVIGFALVDERSALAAEILWAAVRPDQRDLGHGSGLISYVLDVLAGNGVRLVEVKTLDRSSGYAPYEATNAFWQRMGFVQIDAIDPYPGWQSGNPAAIYVAALTSTRASLGTSVPAERLTKERNSVRDE